MSKYQVINYLGHCGAWPNRYVEFEGTKKECEKHIESLPSMEESERCRYCNGFTGTHPIQETCQIESC